MAAHGSKSMAHGKAGGAKVKDPKGMSFKKVRKAKVK